MTPAEYLTAALLIVGSVFFLAGTLGLLRFPDVYTRMHALWRVLRLPDLPPGDVLVPITQGLVLARDGADRLLARCVERWTDITQALDRRIRPLTTKSDIAGFLESMLLRWSPPLSLSLSLSLLLGLLVAWLAAS